MTELFLEHLFLYNNIYFKNIYGILDIADKNYPTIYIQHLLQILEGEK